MNNIKMLYFDRIDISEGIEELILIKQVHQNSMIFVTIDIF